MPVERASIERKGVRISYAIQGKGPPVLLVHGTAMSGSDWFGMDERLAQLGVTVITPDNRGMGHSSVPLPPYTTWEMAEDLSALLRVIDAGPALVYGISLGGMIAQELVLRHPEQVAALVLGATFCGMPHGRLPPPASIAVILRAGLSLGPLGPASGMGKVLAHPDSLSRDPHFLDPVFAAVNRMDLLRRQLAVSGQICAVLAHSTGFRLHRIGCPTEILSGDQDRLIPTANAHVLARRIPGARLTIIPRAGHVFPLEAPEVVPTVVRRLMGQIGWKAGS